MEDEYLIRTMKAEISQIEARAHRLREAVKALEAGITPVVEQARVVQGETADRVATRSNRIPETVQKNGGRHTTEWIVDVLRENGPLTTRQLTQALFARHWTTTSAEPSNTVRTATMRLVSRGQVERMKSGKFRIAAV